MNIDAIYDLYRSENKDDVRLAIRILLNTATVEEIYQLFDKYGKQSGPTQKTLSVTGNWDRTFVDVDNANVGRPLNNTDSFVVGCLVDN